MDLNDFVQQLQRVRKMGPLGDLLGMIPGMGNIKRQLQATEIDDTFFKRAEAIVFSMTPEERRSPELINGSRRTRIADRQRHDAAGREPAAQAVERSEEDHADDGLRPYGQDAGHPLRALDRRRRIAEDQTRTRRQEEAADLSRRRRGRRDRRATAATSRSSATTTRAPNPRPSRSTRTRCATGYRRAPSPPSASRSC